MKAVTKELPEYDYIYYGDTENLPFGDKTEEEVYTLTKIGIENLFKRSCQLVIVACNTASAETLRRLQEELVVGEYSDRRILGMIIPTIETLVEKDKDQALLLATKRTIDSNKYQIELSKMDSLIHLKQVATPDLVPLIEIGDMDLALQTVKKVIDEEGGESEVVVLGCTHYTELKQGLREEYREKVFLSQDEIIPAKLKSYLYCHPELESKLTRGRGREVHLTEHKPYYDKILQHLLGGVLVEE